MIWPRSVGSRIYLAQLAVVAVGLLLVVLGPWRVGLALVGASFVVAAVLRTLVPAAQIGMLKVRGTVFDFAWMTVLGVALVVLAAIIPNQPPL